MSRSILTAAAMATLASAGIASGAAKNVILLIADGGGENVYRATGFYEGKFNNQVYNQPGWEKTYASNHPLRFGTTPIPGAAGLEQDPNVVYDASKAYNITPVSTTTDGYADHFEGYRFHKRSYPDSANTIVSMMTGSKTYNNAVNVDGNGNELPTFTALAKSLGKSTGVVSTVQWGDATPSVAGGAVNVSRGNRNAITDQMMTSGKLDLIMGAGNPDYTNDGTLRATPNHAWISPTSWADLKDGDANGLSGNWKLAQDKADFEALASGTFDLEGKKFLGTYKAFDGHQSYRSGLRDDGTGNLVSRPGPNPSGPTGGFPGADGIYTENLPLYTDPLLDNVPSLPTMAQGALNVLGANPNGFFVMMEAGGVDRAMHANSTTRMIEDMVEFNNMVELVDAYLSANGGAGTDGNNYDNTLVIITGDHDHLVTGANGDTNPFDPILDAGAGNVPITKWQYSSHSNFTIPLFAKGPGSDLFLEYADQLDQFTASNGMTYGNGMYLDQTEINTILTRVVVPEPTTLGVLVGLAALAARRARR